LMATLKDRPGEASAAALSEEIRTLRRRLDNGAAKLLPTMDQRGTPAWDKDFALWKRLLGAYEWAASELKTEYGQEEPPTVCDIVVTVPKGQWQSWIAEGDLPGEAPEYESHFWIGNSALPPIEPGERVYIVAHGKLRGYAPLVRKEQRCQLNPRASCLVRTGNAVAVTIDEPIRGFQGWRYAWWSRDDEKPFPDWMQP
jgi:hypothetical protein